MEAPLCLGFFFTIVFTLLHHLSSSWNVVFTLFSRHLQSASHDLHTRTITFTSYSIIFNDPHCLIISLVTGIFTSLHHMMWKPCEDNCHEDDHWRWCKMWRWWKRLKMMQIMEMMWRWWKWWKRITPQPDWIQPKARADSQGTWTKRNLSEDRIFFFFFF
jgi:hypothetical protein